MELRATYTWLWISILLHNLFDELVRPVPSDFWIFNLILHLALTKGRGAIWVRAHWLFFFKILILWLFLWVLRFLVVAQVIYMWSLNWICKNSQNCYHTSISLVFMRLAGTKTLWTILWNGLEWTKYICFIRNKKEKEIRIN